MKNDRIRIKRAYEPAEKSDGTRVLIDRLWPRGLKKTELPLSDWLKELAPSTELRLKFGHDPKRWKEFKAAYKKELATREARERIAPLAKLARTKTVTLIYSAKDEEHNNAIVLKEVLERLAA